MKRLASILALTLFALVPRESRAFCGFYVGKADTKLFNKASQVVLVRNEEKTVLTMANDFQGPLKEFAIVIPVPTFLEKGQIHVGERALLEHLDAYSAPRLVEYFDGDPCHARVLLESRTLDAPAAAKADMLRAQSLGVKIEAQYTVGEYDIVILSAEQSRGLETWLRENGYKIPAGASEVLGSYLKQGMHFFVAKVNLEEQGKLGYTFLRPLQVAYESPKFMLPIRLGMINANGPQELFLYALTRRGRVETTNYRTVKLPSGMDVPLFVKDEFGSFYKAMFSEQVRREEMRSVFLEYAWDMNWCDPCAASPLSREELKSLGVFWLGDSSSAPAGFVPQGAQEVYLSRLHLRYDGAHFPEDLVFQETGDRQNFQSRYVLRHPWIGSSDCDQARRYREELKVREEHDAETLANLTGWKIGDIRSKMNLAEATPKKEKSWWEKLWAK